MKQTNIKELLIKTTIKLLNEFKSPSDITARQITGKANVNLAMINYYFNSKDELINIAVQRILENAANEWKDIVKIDINPKDKLKKMLNEFSILVIKYSSFTKTSILFDLTQAEILLPYYIIPVLKEYFSDNKSEYELKVIAYMIISFMQLVFIRSEAFFKYTGSDIMDDKVRYKTINIIIDNYLK